MARKLIDPRDGTEWAVGVVRVGAGSREPGGGIPRLITHVTFAHGSESHTATTATEAHSAEEFTDRKDRRFKRPLEREGKVGRAVVRMQGRSRGGERGRW